MLIEQLMQRASVTVLRVNYEEGHWTMQLRIVPDVWAPEEDRIFEVIVVSVGQPIDLDPREVAPLP